MTPEQIDRLNRWKVIGERASLMAARERRERDEQSFSLETGNPIVVQIPLDPDLAELYGFVAGPRYQLTPTDILLVQVIRLYRPGESSVRPAEPDRSDGGTESSVPMGS